MTDQIPDDETPAGIDRRTMLKRGAIVGGALVWTTPVVQSIASPAFAQTSPPPGPDPVGCIGQEIYGGFKYDGQFSAFNVNTNGNSPGGCYPSGNGVAGDANTAFVQPFSASITNDPASGDDLLSFTLAAGTSFVGICAMGGGEPLEPLTLQGGASVFDPATGRTTYTFISPVEDPDISNFSVLLSTCPPA